MKAVLSLLFLVLSGNLFSQKIEQYYDYQWKLTEPASARYLSIVERKDSLWNRQDYFIYEKSLQMEGNFKEAECKTQEGLFTYYHSNKVMESVGKYKNGKRDGLWLRYHRNGLMSDSVTYNMGAVIGLRLRWHSNGFPRDSAVFNEDGSGVEVCWFDNGKPSSAGRFGPGTKQLGKWQYFHRNGNLSASEVYNNGELLSRTYFSEDGQQLSDTTNQDREAEFRGGNKAWQSYLLKQLYFPSQWKFTQGTQAVVIVQWVIDEDGLIQDAEVISSLHPDFDKVALQKIKNSPNWIPAIDHNRKVKAFRRQPITFAQR
ncbi:MAG TPA: energy transducer TonB [Chitinophagaceae bacterium]|nr:energy transducer TonB [Chitinophagaceae bacterium]